MKVKKTTKKEVWGFKMKHGGETEIITSVERMQRIVSGTALGKLDTYEVDPDSRARNNRPWGHVVGMRNLRETGHIETLSADYDLIEA